MEVFKCVFRLILKNKGVLLLYICIFLGITVAITFVKQDNDITDFSMEKMTVGVINHDQSEGSKHLIDYLNKQGKTKDLSECSKKDIQDQIYYREVDYVLTIPKDFETTLKQNKDVELVTYKIPGSYTGGFVDRTVNTYMSTLYTYLNNNETLENAFQKTEEIMSKSSEVELLNNDNAAMKTPSYFYFYNYYGYVIIMLIILSFGIVLSSFYGEEIKKRMNISAINPRKVYFGIYAGVCCFSLLLFILLNIIGVVLCKDSSGYFDKLPYLLINSFMTTMVAVGIGIVSGLLVKSNNAINGIGNTISLGFAFLGGVMVPQSIMNPNMLKVSQCIPTYWFVKANDYCIQNAMNESKYMTEFGKYIGIQFVFAIAFICAGLMISKMKKNEI